jgi:hypothetical protein
MEYKHHACMHCTYANPADCCQLQRRILVSNGASVPKTSWDCTAQQCLLWRHLVVAVALHCRFETLTGDSSSSGKVSQWSFGGNWTRLVAEGGEPSEDSGSGLSSLTGQQVKQQQATELP